MCSSSRSTMAKARFLGVVEAKGGTVLTEYRCSNEKVRIRCKEGHEFAPTPNSVISGGSWCPVCTRANSMFSALRKQKAKEKFLRAVANNGGTALTEYTRSSEKVRIRCEEGHEWEATPNCIVCSRTWCPECAKAAKYLAGNPLPEQLAAKSMAYRQRFLDAVAEKGGTALDQYRSCGHKIRIRCREGHEWEGWPHSVVVGSWCPTCSGKPESLELRFLGMVAREGGTALTKFRRGDKKVRIRCKDGHEFGATPSRVCNNCAWCPACARDARRRPRD